MNRHHHHLAASLLAGLLTAATAAGAGTITVNATADTSGGAACTLRDALTAASTRAATGGCAAPGSGTTTIAFNIPAATDPGCNAATGVCTIRPLTQLPYVTSAMDINGYTQPGASPNTLPGMRYPDAQGLDTQIRIELDGSLGPTGTAAIVINSQADGNRVRGLSIVNFHTAVIFNFGDNGRATGNFIGVRADGLTRGSVGSYGISMGAYGSYVTVGGLDAADRNLLAGPGTKAFINGGNGHTVVGNLIGTDRTGAVALADGDAGVYIRGTDGPATRHAILANVIGNSSLIVLGTQDTMIAGNAVGVGVGGAPLPAFLALSIRNNEVAASQRIRLSGNAFANIQHTPVLIAGQAATGNPGGVTIDATNAFWNNGGPAIALAPANGGIDTPAPNDPPPALDADTGPNGLQNYPVVASAKYNAQGGIDIAYQLDSAASRVYRLAAWSSPACSASGYGEGRYPSGLAFPTVTTDGAGHRGGVLTIPAPLPAGWGPGQVVTMLATDTQSGDTSGFSPCVALAGGAPATPAAFSFAPLTGVAANTEVASNPVTLAGIVAAVPVTITGGLYSINGGAWTSAPGTARAGDSITVRLTSPAYAGATATATLAAGGASAAFAVTTAAVANPVVAEYYNIDLNNYFITADPVEQAMVDTGAVGRWERTGNTFQAGGASQVCRFFGNGATNPATGRIYGPNSHFYTADPAECASLKAQFSATAKSWVFESNDFATTSAAAGACPAGTVAVYRAYNNGFAHNLDSNHRITGNYAAFGATVAAGWSGEGIVMCAPSPQGAAGGAGTCVGSYAASTQPAGCPNALPSGDALVLGGFDLAQPGWIEGKATLANLRFGTRTDNAGQCAIRPASHADAVLALTGTWNGNSGALRASAGGTTWAGRFTVAAGRATGTLSPAGGTADAAITFTCALQ